MTRSTACLAIGFLVMTLAVAWWWLTYQDVIQYAYLSTREASLCLFGRSTICDLARSLCRGAHPAVIIGYWWGTFWVGAIVVSASLAFDGSRRT